jgi:hypothetical protein
MRIPLALAPIALVAMLLVGCDGGDDSTTVAPQGAAGDAAKADVRGQWEESPSCARPQGASRWGCSVGPYRCQAVVVDRGWSVDCAKPGRSLAFTVPPRK